MEGAAHVLERLGRGAPDHLDPESAYAVVKVLRATVPFDGWCLLGLDPKGLHRTFEFSRDGSEGTRELTRLEGDTAEVNRYADLARAAVPAGWLSAAHPRARTSVRLNEHLRPQGITSELRVVLRDRRQTWGALVMLRRGGPDFDDNDVAVVAACGPALAAMARREGARVTSAQVVPGDGLVLLDAYDRIVTMSGAAIDWLADLVPGGDDGVGQDDVTRVVYDTAHAARAARCASVTRRTPTGRWLTVSASPLGEQGDVAVQLRAATGRERLTVLTCSVGLTRRETEVLDRLALGLPTKQLASALGIGVWTVEDHLGSIYRKLGLRGRDELIALLVDLAATPAPDRTAE